jgi:hypothetical protein
VIDRSWKKFVFVVVVFFKMDAEFLRKLICEIQQARVQEEEAPGVVSEGMLIGENSTP